MYSVIVKRRKAMYEINSFMAELERKNPAQSEFIQAVREVVESVIDVVNENPVYLKNKILERIIFVFDSHLFCICQ